MKSQILKNNQENRNNKEDRKIEERVLLVRRISKKTPGGNYISFSVLVGTGDKRGKVGIGLGRGLEVPIAIRKGINYAKKHMISVPIYQSSLPHNIKLKYKGASLILKPAPQGSGLKVGSVIRSILSLAGITNASGKILGSRNQITNAYAVMEALKKLKVKSDTKVSS